MLRSRCSGAGPHLLTASLIGYATMEDRARPPPHAPPSCPLHRATADPGGPPLFPQFRGRIPVGSPTRLQPKRPHRRGRGSHGSQRAGAAGPVTGRAVKRERARAPGGGRVHGEQPRHRALRGADLRVDVLLTPVLRPMTRIMVQRGAACDPQEHGQPCRHGKDHDPAPGRRDPTLSTAAASIGLIRP
jgi:hypothetical protein